MPAEDAEMTRAVRREINRRQVDTTYLDIRVMHGIVYLRGRLLGLNGREDSLDEEFKIICRVLRQLRGVRDVIPEIELGRPGLRESVSAAKKPKGLI